MCQIQLKNLPITSQPTPNNLQEKYEYFILNFIGIKLKLREILLFPNITELTSNNAGIPI